MGTPWQFKAANVLMAIGIAPFVAWATVAIGANIYASGIASPGSALFALMKWGWLLYFFAMAIGGLGFLWANWTLRELGVEKPRSTQMLVHVVAITLLAPLVLG